MVVCSSPIAVTYIYPFLGVSLSCSFVIVSELFRGNFLETSIILSAVLLPIKSPVASAVLQITLFEVVLSAFVVYCLT